MLVFGKNVAIEMLKKEKMVNKIYLQENFNDKNILSLIEKSGIIPQILSKNKLDSLSNGLHQGIILDICDYKYKTMESISNDSKLVVILDHLEDPHNLGAIIRTCEAAGVDAIVIPKDRQVQVNSTVMKTSVGTIFDVNIILVSNLVNAIKKLKEKGFWIVGTSLENSIDYRDIDYSGKIGLVIGNEGKGISRLVSKECDFICKIPMYGKTNSLNASVAAGIMIYEAVKNRK